MVSSTKKFKIGKEIKVKYVKRMLTIKLKEK